MVTRRLSARALTELLAQWRGHGPTYSDLSDTIVALVRNGLITTGTALPAERPLAEALGVSRTTVSAGYHDLRDRGVAVSRQGSGTVIRAPRETPALAPAPTRELAGVDLSCAAPEAWPGLAALHAAAFAAGDLTFAGLGYDTIGQPALRQAIADRYAQRGLATHPGQIMVTLGAQHAIFLLARTLLGRGDRTLIESPSYPHAREALVATGALIAELPVGLHGYDHDAILDIARRTSARLAYLMPDHHNPTGQSMPPALKQQLIATLAAQGTYMIADETTAELTLDGARLVTPFAAFADQPHQQDAIVTVGSLGKTVWGGLRIGWIRATPDLIARLEVSRRVGDLGTGAWEQVIATRVLDRYDEVLADRSAQLSERRDVVRAEVARRLPEWQLSDVVGGAYFWADLGAPRSTALSRECERLGLRLPPGPRFGSPGVFERFTRLPFAAPPEVLHQAMGVIHTAWQRSEAARAQTPEQHAFMV